MGELASKLSFVNFKEICSGCKENCCRRFYAVLLPEEEDEFKDVAFEVETSLGPVKCIGSRNGRPCPYLSSSGYCEIYERRPFDCRIWPILIYIDFETRERVVYLDLECPAVRDGRLSRDLVSKVVKSLGNAEMDEEWLEKYTLAPWPNNLVEILRLRGRRSEVARLTKA